MPGHLDNFVRLIEGLKYPKGFNIINVAKYSTKLKSMEPVSREIRIHGNSLFTDIQKAFSLFYPFLKIEYSKGEKDSRPFKNDKIALANTINQLAKVNVDNTRTIAEIAVEFKDIFGWSIHIFRKSGKVWNVISLTDNWTLESQNKAGEFISSEMAAAS